MGIGRMRNDWVGDVGISFVPRTAIILVALGRQLHNSAQCREAAIVTLWSADAQVALASATVGPQSPVEVGYAFAPLVADVILESGKEYRLSQQCTRGMADHWFDGAAPATELTQSLTTRYVTFGGSVYAEGFGFPDKVDDDPLIPSQCRRAGMLNFKMKGQDPAAEALQLQCADGVRGVSSPSVDTANVDGPSCSLDFPTGAACTDDLESQQRSGTVDVNRQEILVPQLTQQIRLVCMSSPPGAPPPAPRRQCKP